MRKTKVLTVFGTRPEVIKLAPFIKALERDARFESITCATTQHRALQDDVLQLFGIHPRYDLDVMIDGQDLYHVTESVLTRIRNVLEIEKPNYTVVQGDTTTAFSAALASFYHKIPVVHIEAGLRTGNLYRPFPEEANRSLISRIATHHMAPTQQAFNNLANEGITTNVHLVGNTIVDAVDWILSHHHNTTQNKSQVLVTVHRRENFGEPLHEICEAITLLAKEYPQYTFVWPVHPNPNVQNYIHKNMGQIPNIQLMEPVSYEMLINLLNNSSIVLSDSGGIQEESCILGKQILILREETERPEVVESGFGTLVGANTQKIVQTFKQALSQQTIITKKTSPYGSVGVSERILSILHPRSSSSTCSKE